MKFIEEPQDATPQELTEDELLVIRRFLLLVTDDGIQAILMLRICAEYNNDQTPRMALKKAIADLVRVCQVDPDEEDRHVKQPEKIAAAAPSLRLIAELLSMNASDRLIIPPDFIPSQELVNKCMRSFYVDLRQNADD